MAFRLATLVAFGVWFIEVMLFNGSLVESTDGHSSESKNSQEFHLKIYNLMVKIFPFQSLSKVNEN